MRIRLLRKRIIFLLVGFFVVGCSNTPIQPTVTFTIPAPTITPLPEGPMLVKKIGSTYIPGTLYGHGEVAVLLASRGGYNQSEWAPFAQTLANEGFTALTMSSLDSEGQTIQYIGYGIDFLIKHDFKHIVCIGASNGASGCAFHAKEPEITGLVLITYHGSADLSNITIPKLFLAAEEENTYRPVTEREYPLAAEPKTLTIVPGTSATGPALLDTPEQDLNNIVLDFVRKCVQ